MSKQPNKYLKRVTNALMLWKTNSYVKFSFLFVLIGQICQISISFDEGMKEDVADVLFKTHFLL